MFTLRRAYRQEFQSRSSSTLSSFLMLLEYSQRLILAGIRPKRSLLSGTFLILSQKIKKCLKKLRKMAKVKSQAWKNSIRSSSQSARSKLKFTDSVATLRLNFIKISYTAQILHSTLLGCIRGSQCISQLGTPLWLTKAKSFTSQSGETTPMRRSGMNGPWHFSIQQPSARYTPLTSTTSMVEVSA